MAVLFLLLVVVFTYVSNNAFLMLGNYNAMRKLKIPILLAPVTWQNALWMLLHRRLSPCISRLPFNLGGWTYYSAHGWELQDRYKMHTRLGPIFAIVSPYKNEIIVADPAAADVLMSRWRDWLKSPDLYKMFDVFGKNVNSVNGEDWQRHRKITSFGFNERNNALVWAESRRQAEGMLQKWTFGSNLTMKGVVEDTRLLALHVLSSAALGHSYPFQKGVQEPSPGHTMSYGTAIGVIMQSIMETILFGSTKLPLLFLPRSLKDLVTAVAEFKAYMVEGVQEEKDALAAAKVDPRHNLLSALVRANEIAKKEEGEKTRDERRGGLSDEELYGNLFMFNVGGHETTANTFSYLVALLAVQPEVQEWVGEEVDEVFGSLNKDTDDKEVDYQDVFPRLRRCQALMYEQLRIYGPLPALIKYTGPTAQPLTIKFPTTGAEETYLIPSDTYIAANFVALHCDEAWWGPDALEWKPQRWITTSSSTADTTKASGLASETLAPPPAANGATSAPSFVPWASGPRVCPGKKFSQVEFVAVMSCLLHRHRVRIVKRQGENEMEARARVLNMVKDSEFHMTPKMRRPESVEFVWVEK